MGRIGRRGLGRRRRGLGDERDESLRDGDGVGRQRRGLGDERDESLTDGDGVGWNDDGVGDESLRELMRA